MLNRPSWLFLLFIFGQLSSRSTGWHLKGSLLLPYEARGSLGFRYLILLFLVLVVFVVRFGFLRVGLLLYR
jgi:hypothetical protein